MNELEIKLELAFHGYSPDAIGCLTYVLNKSISISESKIREIYEATAPRAAELPRGISLKTIFHTTVESLKAKFQGKRPEYQDVATELITKYGKVISKDVLERIAQYIREAWDEFDLIAEPTPGSGQDDPAFHQRLSEVPTAGEQEWQGHVKSWLGHTQENMPQTLNQPASLRQMQGYVDPQTPRKPPPRRIPQKSRQWTAPVGRKGGYTPPPKIGSGMRDLAKRVRGEDIDWEAMLKRLKERRDPEGLE